MAPKKKILIIVSTLIITLLVILGALFIFLNNSKQIELSGNSDLTISTPTSEPINSVSEQNYFGKFINSYLPDGWKIIEYSDENGMGSRTLGGKYSGFTRLQIDSPITGSIYSIAGQDGVGGATSCSTIYKFNDTDPNYIKHLEDIIKELGAMEDPPRTVTPEVIDLGNKSYSQVKLFNRSGRRIDNIIYWNELNSGNYFNPICPQNVSRMKFENVFFYNNGSKQDLYSASFFRGDYTSDELEQLDLILNSIVLK